MLTIEAQYSLSTTIKYMVEMQHDLHQLLRDCAVSGGATPQFSMYSSHRIFRKEELFLGLHRLNHFCEACKN